MPAAAPVPHWKALVVGSEQNTTLAGMPMAARLPLLSVVTTLSAPDCAFVLAAAVTPGSV
jgi:hypothetical protein